MQTSQWCWRSSGRRWGAWRPLTRQRRTASAGSTRPMTSSASRCTGTATSRASCSGAGTRSTPRPVPLLPSHFFSSFPFAHGWGALPVQLAPHTVCTSFGGRLHLVSWCVRVCLSVCVGGISCAMVFLTCSGLLSACGLWVRPFFGV